jgi:nucleoporin POM152
MNGTPRLRSAFPATPQPNSRAAGSSNLRNGGLAKPKVVPPKPSDPSLDVDLSPRIPLNILDAASQRLFAFAFYICLWAWRLADFWALYTSDDTQSFPLFMKWVLIDAAFLFGLPGLRIPWISWSGSAMTVLFLTHAFFNAVLMFQIGLPVAYLVESVVKLVYEREIAISERRVKPASVLDHSSLILGKQVIHILPEGYVDHYMYAQLTGPDLPCSTPETSISASAGTGRRSKFRSKSTKQAQT